MDSLSLHFWLPDQHVTPSCHEDHEFVIESVASRLFRRTPSLIIESLKGSLKFAQLSRKKGTRQSSYRLSYAKFRRDFFSASVGKVGMVSVRDNPRLSKGQTRLSCQALPSVTDVALPYGPQPVQRRGDWTTLPIMVVHLFDGSL